MLNEFQILGGLTPAETGFSIMQALPRAAGTVLAQSGSNECRWKRRRRTSSLRAQRDRTRIHKTEAVADMCRHYNFNCLLHY
jgi:hypothetical protein